MKTLKFEVELEFTCDVSDGEHAQIAEIVRHALVGEVDHGNGYAPIRDEEDSWTKSIAVRTTVDAGLLVLNHTF